MDHVKMETDKGRPYHRQDAYTKHSQKRKSFNVPEVNTTADPQARATFWSRIHDPDNGAAELFPEQGEPIEVQIISGPTSKDAWKGALVRIETTEVENPWGMSKFGGELNEENQVALFFIPLSKTLHGPNAGFSTFSALGEALDALPQLLSFSFQGHTSAMREILSADFAAQVIHLPPVNQSAQPKNSRGVYACFSILHCKITDSLTPSVRRTVIHLQLSQPSRPEWEKESPIRMVSVLIGRHELKRLQKEYIQIGVAGLNEKPGTYPERSLDLRYVHAAFIGRIATDGWMTALDFIEDDMDQVVYRFSPAVDVDSDSIALLNDLYSIEIRLNTIIAQLRTNLQVFQGLIEWKGRHPSVNEHIKFHAAEFMNASIKLQCFLLRTEDITRNLTSAMRQAERVTKFAHSAKSETILWHSLKMNYTVETLINRTTFLLVIFLPGIFASAFFSSNFFVVTQDLEFKAASVWIWFVVTVPLGILTLLAIYLLHLWHTNGWTQVKDYLSKRSKSDSHSSMNAPV